MSLIQLYLDKDNDSNNEIINLLKEQSVNFLQYNIKNNKTNIKKYGLTSIPTLKFKDLIINDINEETIKEVVNKFNAFIDNLPVIKMTDKIETIPDDFKGKNKKPKNQILVKTIKIINKENLNKQIKEFSRKYKK